jgi:hypothetical protein
MTLPFPNHNLLLFTKLTFLNFLNHFEHQVKTWWLTLCTSLYVAW